MPVISFKLWDVERLCKCEIPREPSKLDEILSNLKMGFEGIEDDEITVEVAHDRADLYSAEGIGRALRFFLGIEKPSKYEVKLANTYIDVSEAPKYRPYAYMVIVRNVSLDDESIRQLFQLQEKLHLSHCGDRSLVSIGLYDLDKLKAPFKYASVPNYEFIPLEETRRMSIPEILRETEKGRKYAHLVRHNEYPILIDSGGTVLSFPPIINSEETKVTEDTRNIVIDVTGTEPYIMAKIIAIMALSTLERSYGKGEIEIVPVKGNDNLTNTLQKIFNGSIIEVISSNVENLIGIKLNVDEIQKILSRLGYVSLGIGKNSISVWVPPYRLDVIDEADVIEDIAIGYGYNEIEPRLPPPTHSGSIDLIERFSNILRDLMIGLGYNEVVNFIMTDEEFLKRLGGNNYVSIENPKMKTYSALRNSLLPSLLLTVKVNKELHQVIKVFEIGDVVKVINNEPRTYRYLGFAISKPNATLTDALATLKTLFRNFGIKYALEKYTLRPIFIEGRSAKVIVDGVVIGVVGEVHPSILTELGILQPVVLSELCINDLLNKLRA